MVAQDLLAFRIAMSKLESLESSNDRRQEPRYMPSGHLAKARVQLRADEAQLEDADVVDLSPSGLRLAVAPGTNYREGERCLILIGPNASTTWSLDGEIRWVSQHPYITVFGVLLDPDHAPVAPV